MKQAQHTIKKENEIIVKSNETGTTHRFNILDGKGKISRGISRFSNFQKEGVLDLNILSTDGIPVITSKTNDRQHIVNEQRECVTYFSTELNILDCKIKDEETVHDSKLGIDPTQPINQKSIPTTLDEILSYFKSYVNSNVTQQAIVYAACRAYELVSGYFHRKGEVGITFPITFIDVMTTPDEKMVFKALLWKRVKKSRMLGAKAGKLQVIEMPSSYDKNFRLSAMYFPYAMYSFFLSRGLYMDVVWEDELPSYRGRKYFEDRYADNDIVYKIKSIRNVVLHSPRQNHREQSIMALVDWEISEFNEGFFSEKPDDKSYLSWISIANLVSCKVLMQYFKFRAPFLIQDGKIYPKDFSGLINPEKTDKEDYFLSLAED